MCVYIYILDTLGGIPFMPLITLFHPGFSTPGYILFSEKHTYCNTTYCNNTKISDRESVSLKISHYVSLEIAKTLLLPMNCV